MKTLPAFDFQTVALVSILKIPPQIDSVIVYIHVDVGIESFNSILYRLVFLLRNVGREQWSMFAKRLNVKVFDKKTSFNQKLSCRISNLVSALKRSFSFYSLYSFKLRRISDIYKSWTRQGYLHNTDFVLFLIFL